MPVLQPFRAFRYNADVVSLEEVVAPPYDVIGPEYQERLYARHPNNVVRLILGREEDRYASAAGHFRTWKDRGILTRDAKPSLYVVHQEFDGLDGRRATRKGFIALCRLEEFSSRVVLPHEKTLAKPREDRLKLFTATNANFSQVFSLYWDLEKRIDEAFAIPIRSAPLMRVDFEDVVNSVWRADDMKIVERVVRFMSDKQVVIADGHHRYETALAYRDLMRAKSPSHSGKELYNYIMMFFSNIEDDGLVIYPTHRVVHSLQTFSAAGLLDKLGKTFHVQVVQDMMSMQTTLDCAVNRTFGLVLKDDPKLYCISLEPNVTASVLVTEALPAEVKELDVTVLHTVILRDALGISSEAQEQKRNLDYVRVAADAVGAVRGGRAQAAFILRPTQLEEVRSVARAGHVMPQKSTYFFPKLLSGLLFNLMEE